MDSVIKLFGHLFAPEDRGLCLVTVDGGVVTSIEPAGEPVEGSLGGKTSRILPGLIDIQVNGAFGDDFADPSADMDRICKGMLAFGVTGFVPTVVTSPAAAYQPALAHLRRSHRPGEARVLGVHIEGPFISPTYRGTHSAEQIRLPNVDEAARWLEDGDIRYVTLAPELPGALDADHIPGQAWRAGIDGSHGRHLGRRRRGRRSGRGPGDPLVQRHAAVQRIAIRALSGSSWRPTLPPASSPTATTSPSRRSG